MLQGERKPDPKPTKPTKPKTPSSSTTCCHTPTMYLSQFGVLGAKCWSLYPAPGSGFVEHYSARLALMLVFKLPRSKLTNTYGSKM